MRAQKLFFKSFTIVHGINEAIFGNGVWPPEFDYKDFPSFVKYHPSMG